jgi:hypothetical protein
MPSRQTWMKMMAITYDPKKTNNQHMNTTNGFRNRFVGVKESSRTKT